jgi:hypothetical protein
VEGPQGADALAKDGLLGGNGGDGAGGVRGRFLGQALSDDRTDVAASLGLCGAVLRVPAGQRIGHSPPMRISIRPR